MPRPTKPARPTKRPLLPPQTRKAQVRQTQRPQPVRSHARRTP